MKRIFDGLTNQFARARAEFEPRKGSPDELLGELFQDVQFRRIFHDGMRFVDMVPANKLRSILKEYAKHRHDPYFDLPKFVEEHFKDYIGEPTSYHTNPNHTVEQHISELWDVLTRRVYKNSGSLIALPHPYVVAGGRFSAQFYWDSYFVMLGLAADNRWDMVENMVKNFAFMLRKFGHIPNGNRTYFVGRSQPPLFAAMVRLLAEHNGSYTLVKYLPHMLLEYHFWMKGKKDVTSARPARLRVVRMPDGTLLNRYFDNKSTPRPESYKEDVDTAVEAGGRTPSKVYLDLRAAAESGWDFSSRWLADPQKLATIHTTDIVPVDLNSFMVMLEQTIADAYTTLKQAKVAAVYRRLAEQRQEAISHYCWDADEGFFFDYDLVTHEHTPYYTLAAATPLWVGAATSNQAASVAQLLQNKFLKKGGLVCTLDTTGQQWDAPNGWAPLQWMAVQGLRRYGHGDLAEEIKHRWVMIVTDAYKESGKLVEKYNVVDPTMAAGGGEYVLQDGFGWTNGVLLAMLREGKDGSESA